MPIRGFEPIFLNKATSKEPLNTIEKSIVAIDGMWLIRRHVFPFIEKDFLDVPASFDRFLEDVFRLNEKISILWIWDGIEARQTYLDLENTITDISNTIIERHSFKWQKFYDPEFFINSISKKLLENGVAVMRAPYYAAAQCAYFLSQKKVDYVYGRTDTLLFKDCDKLITDFDFKNNMFTLLDRNLLFEKFKMNLESFRRLAFLSGCEYCMTVDFFSSSFDIQKIVDLLKQNENLEIILRNHGISSDHRYYTEYLNAFTIVNNTPVMGLDGVVRQLTNEPSQKSISDVFGDKLSNNIYHKIYTCQLTTKPLENLFFNRFRSFIDTSLIGLLKLIWESQKSTEYLKNIPLSEFIADKLNLYVVWNPNFNRMSQILFHLMLKKDNNPQNLMMLLNSGFVGQRTSKKEVTLTQSMMLVYLSSTYSPKNIAYLYEIQENMILLNSIIDLMKIYFPQLQNDMQFDFKFSYLMLPLEKDPLKQFINENIKNDIRIDDFNNFLDKE